jgi:hypothetical protein
MSSGPRGSTPEKRDQRSLVDRRCLLDFGRSDRSRYQRRRGWRFWGRGSKQLRIRERSCLSILPNSPVLHRMGRSARIYLAFLSGNLALRVPGMGVDGRGDLLTSGFPRRLQDGLADAEGQCEIRQHSPRVLHVPFVLVCLEVPFDGGDLGR